MMKTLLWICLLLCAFSVDAAQTLLSITNGGGVTAIKSSNAPIPALKGFVATQFGTNSSNNFIRPGATVTNFNVVSNLTLPSVGTNMVLATDSAGNVVATTVSGGGTNTVAPTNSNFIITSNAVPAFNALTTNTSTNAMIVLASFRLFSRSTGLQHAEVQAYVVETNGATSLQGWLESVESAANQTNTYQLTVLVPPGAFWYYTNISTDATNAVMRAGAYYTAQLITGGSGTAGGAGSGTITNVAFMSDWLQISGSPLTGGGGTITGNMPYMPANSNTVVVINDGLTTLSNGVTVLSNQVVTINSGLTTLSNGVTVVSNGLTTLSNLWALTSAGLTVLSNGTVTVSNGLLALSNQVVVINAGLVVVSNGLTVLSNTVVTLAAGQVTFSNAYAVWTNAFTLNYQAATNALGVRITSLEAATNGMSAAANGVSNRVGSLETYTNVAYVKINGTKLAWPVLDTNSATVTLGTNADGSRYWTVVGGGGTAGTLINSNLTATSAGQLIQFLGADKTNTGPVTVGSGLTLSGGTLSVTNSTNNGVYTALSETMNTVLTNGTNIGWVTFGIKQTASITDNPRAALYIESSQNSGVFNQVDPTGSGALSSLVTSNSVQGFVAPLARYYCTNQGATVSIIAGSAWIFNITGGLAGGSGGGSTATFDPTQFGGSAGGTNILSGVILTNAAMRGDTVITNLVAWTNVLGKVAAYTMSTNDNVLYVDPGASNTFITLPSAVTVPGKFFEIKNVTTSITNILFITNSSSQTIDGMTAISLRRRGESVVLKSDGTNWLTFGRPAPSGFLTRGTTGAAGSRWLTTPHNGDNLANLGAISTNLIRLFPVIIPRMATIDEIGIGLQTVGSAGAECRLALYRDDGNGYPYELMFESTRITNTVGSGSIVASSNSLPMVVEAGLYWLAHNHPAPQAQFYGFPTVGSMQVVLLEDGVTESPNTHFGWSLTNSTTVYTNFPAFFPTGASRIVTTPMLRMLLHFSN